MKKTTLGITLCGILSAMSVVIMLAAGLLPITSYALPMIAGALCIIPVVELNIGWACSVYVVTALISGFLLPNKTAAMLYILFFGFYPIIKALFERIPSRILAFVPKLAVFNASAIGAYYLSIWLLEIPAETFVLFGVSLPWLFLLAGNLIFIVYDLAISGLVVLYFKRLHPMLAGWMQKK